MLTGMSRSPETILLVITDPVLHPEALHLAAATGRKIIDTTEPGEVARHFPRADVVLVDAGAVETVAVLARRPGVYFLAADPGPIDWRAALRSHAEQALVIPAQATELLKGLGREEAPTGRVGRVIGVTGVCGGVGVSTFAAAIARTARAEEPALIDADPAAGGLDLLLGAEEAVGARWPDLSFGDGAVSGTDLRRALPTTVDGITLLSGARSAIADPHRLSAEELVAALNNFRAGISLSVVDLPTRGSCREAVVDLCDLVVLVVPAEVRAAAAAAQQVARWRSGQVEATVVVRHRGWSGLEIADVEKLTRTEVLAEIGTITRLPKQVEMQGLPETLPKTLSVPAQAVLAQLSEQRAGR